MILADQLRAAIGTRAVIDQAIGILMAQQRCNATVAFEQLRKTSQDGNLRVSTVASDLITATSGEPPHPPRPFITR